MGKILDVKTDIVKVGTDDGKIREVRRDDLNFDPKIGDKVDLFEDENSVIVSKIEDTNVVNSINPSTGGLNININNSNSNENSSNDASQYTGYGKKVVNKVVYLILAFFLGGIGIHKFYAGKIGAGICYLLFSWTFIPSFIAFIEFIVALCAKADSNGNILV